MRHLSLAKIEAICTGHARSSRQNKQEATLSLRVFHNFGRSSLWKIEVCLLKKVSRKSSTGRNSCPHALVVEENRITFVSGKKDISRCKIFWIKNKSNSILKIKLRSIVAFALLTTLYIVLPVPSCSYLLLGHLLIRLECLRLGLLEMKKKDLLNLRVQVARRRQGTDYSESMKT